MTIGRKLGLSFTGMTLLFGLVGFVGYYGTYLLEKSLHYITGPAWETADGTMNTLISLQQQIIHVDALIDGAPVEQQRTLIRDAQEERLESLQRLMGSPLVSEQDHSRLQGLIDAYDQNRNSLIKHHAEFTATDQQLRASFEGFRGMMVEAEELGDQQVEELENNPDLTVSWRNGLEERWTAADGGMETSIFLLERFYFYQRMVNNPDQIPKYQGAFQESLESLRATLNELMNHPLFLSRRSENGTLFSELFERYLREHEALFGKAVTQLQTMHADQRRYKSQMLELQAFLEQLEANGDALVEAKRDEAIKLQDTVSTAMIVLFLIALILVIGLGVWLIQNITSLLKHLVSELSSSSSQLGLAAGQISDSSIQVSSGATEQASSLEETAASMEQISSQVRENADNASYVATTMESVAHMIKQSNENTRMTEQLSEEAKSAAQEGVKAMTAINSAMNDIRSGSDQITAIIEVIDSITHQTKMLATNAAIEAARAGEHGKGFAVVADEVSKLAENSKQAAKEIASLIRASVSKSKEGGSLALQGEKALQDILERNVKVSDLIAEVAASSNEQSRKIDEVENLIRVIKGASSEQANGVEQVSIAINQMNSVTQTNASTSEETASAAEKLSEQAEVLGELVTDISRHVGIPPDTAALAKEPPPRSRETARALSHPPAVSSRPPEPRLKRPEVAAAQLPAPRPKSSKQVKPGDMIPMRDDFSEF